MISQILQHLESLQVELMKIDPAHDCDAADKVADLAADLRSALSAVRPQESVTDRSTRLAKERNAA